MLPVILNYDQKFFDGKKWIFIPSVLGERRSIQVLKFFDRSVTFPDYFFHYKAGGHVAALHDHLQHDFFF